MKKIKCLLVVMLMAVCFNTQALAATPEIQIVNDIMSLVNVPSTTCSVKITFDIEENSKFYFNLSDELENAYVKNNSLTGLGSELFIVETYEIANSSGKIVLGEILFDGEVSGATVEVVTTSKTTTEYKNIAVKISVIDDTSGNSSNTVNPGIVTVVPPTTSENDDIIDDANEETTDENELTTSERYDVIYKTYYDITSSWAKESIAFVVDQGLFQGVSDRYFEPTMTMDRAMFVTVLSRIENSTATSSNSVFTDVSSSSWYASAVAWAVENKITTGTTTSTFSPTQSVTREQMAVFLNNYAKAMNITIPSTNAKSTFADDSSISSWAVEAVYVMQQSGILTGKDGNQFDPQGEASRAEVATMIERFVKLK